jgi:DNA-binding response OmpR family regulator
MEGGERAPTVLRILIVEDTPERQAWLRGLFREHAWILVHTAARAIRLVQAYDLDLVSLDYNLAGPEPGEAVAAALAASRNARTPVLVHSMNPQGARRIAQHLPAAACVPVATLVRTNAGVHRLRAALRDGVPADWRAVLAGRGGGREP